MQAAYFDCSEPSERTRPSSGPCTGSHDLSLSVSLGPEFMALVDDLRHHRDTNWVMYGPFCVC